MLAHLAHCSPSFVADMESGYPLCESYVRRYVGTSLRSCRGVLHSHRLPTWVSPVYPFANLNSCDPAMQFMLQPASRLLSALFSIVTVTLVMTKCVISLTNCVICEANKGTYERKSDRKCHFSHC